MNNFVGGQDQGGNGGKTKGRDNAQSHSPSGLHAGGSQGGKGQILQGTKVKKGLKVINNSK